MSKVHIIPTSLIDAGDGRQRKFFDETALAELEESIFSNVGLIQPIQVIPRGERYVLVAGERRLKSIRNRPEQSFIFSGEGVSPGFIPATFAAADDEVVLMEAELAENTRRADLHWKERVEAEARLHELKTRMNPKHTIKDTAALVTDRRDEAGRPAPTPHEQTRAKQSVLIARYMDDPDVAKASNRRQAWTAAMARAEQEFVEVTRKQQASAPPPVVAQADDALFGAPTITAQDLIPEAPEPEQGHYTVGRHTLYHGDCRDILPTLPANTYNIIITDPPYVTNTTQFGSASVLRHKYSYKDAEELYSLLCEEATRLCTADAHIYIFTGTGDDSMFDECRQQLEELGWKVRSRPLFWHKPSRGFLTDGDGRGWRASYETILHARRGSRPGSFIHDDILPFSPVRNKAHAAQKPKALLAALLKMSAVPGDRLLDPFAGSGAIFPAAEEVQVKATGIEKSDDSINIAWAAMRGVEPKGEEDDERLDE